jgi:hypothetical protein
LPQRPHAALFAEVASSHPFAALPSQSPKPSAHAVIAQAAAAQVALATFAVRQLRPHAPQCATLDASSTSHPLAASPSHSPRPAAQVDAQRPAAHEGAVLGGVGHASPHRPQCDTLARRSVSQPLLATPSQSPYPSAQRATAHDPASQRAVAFGSAQARPQAPQAARDVRVSVSHPLVASPSQSEKPTAQSQRHAPTSQRAAALGREAHARSQPPQCRTSPRVLASQPVSGARSQSAKGSAQAPTAQVPLRQAGVALASAQGRPHPPQCAALACGSTQAPLQQVAPAGHACEGLQPATQRFPTQRLPGGQCASVTHATQPREATSHRGAARVPPSARVAPTQSSSRSQPRAQVRVLISQY